MMFSRFLRPQAAVVGQNALFVRSSDNVARATTAASSAAPSKEDKADSKRDLVNFPRWPLPIECPPIRVGIFPETWFTQFYDKTGVTGPYLFLTTFGTYLVSKEIYVPDHEFPLICSLAILGTYVSVNYGSKIRKAIDESIDQANQKLDSVRQNEIDRCNENVAAEENAQWMASSYEGIIQAQRESVGLQLELAYRERLQSVYQQVKQRLDYQVELVNVMQRIEQKHMAKWIIDEVRKSLTSKHQDDALKQCLVDLKALAVTSK